MNHLNPPHASGPEMPQSSPMDGLGQWMVDELGFVPADPSFSLSKSSENLDMVREGKRSLLYPQSAADDEAYDLLSQSEVRQFPRIDVSGGVVAVEVPIGVKPLSRLVMSDRPAPAGGTSMGLSDVLAQARDLLHVLHEQTGKLPEAASLNSFAFAKNGEGAMYLVPPLRLSTEVDSKAVFGSLLDEIRETAPPRSYRAAKSVFGRDN